MKNCNNFQICYDYLANHYAAFNWLRCVLYCSPGTIKIYLTSLFCSYCPSLFSLPSLTSCPHYIAPPGDPWLVGSAKLAELYHLSPFVLDLFVFKSVKWYIIVLDAAFSANVFMHTTYVFIHLRELIMTDRLKMMWNMSLSDMSSDLWSVQWSLICFFSSHSLNWSSQKKC